MILPDVREAALEEVTRALRQEIGDDPLLSQRAENLLAIVIDAHLSVEELLRWIEIRTPEKEWSADECRRWAKAVCDAREALAVSHAGGESTRVCPGCYAAIAQRTQDGRWWCSHCGVVA